MNLFIETDEMRMRGPRGAVRDEGRSLFSAAQERTEPAAPHAKRPDASYSLEQETYRKEIDYDKRRSRRRKVLAMLRVVAAIVFVPMLLLGLFVASYVITCILKGATPQEVVELMGELFTRMGETVKGALDAVVNLVP